MCSYDWSDLAAPAAALFIIAKKWKQSKRPSTDEQVNKMQYYLDSGASLATIKNEVLVWGTAGAFVQRASPDRKQIIRVYEGGVWLLMSKVSFGVSFGVINVLELVVIAVWPWEYTELYTLNRWTALVYESHLETKRNPEYAKHWRQSTRDEKKPKQKNWNEKQVTQENFLEKKKKLKLYRSIAYWVQWPKNDQY